jgi:hypothetical protein
LEILRFAQDDIPGTSEVHEQRWHVAATPASRRCDASNLRNPIAAAPHVTQASLLPGGAETAKTRKREGFAKKPNLLRAFFATSRPSRLCSRIS